MPIVALLDSQGKVLGLMDWRDATPLPANIRAATPDEIAANLASAPPTILNPADFLARFTPQEQIAVQQAAIVNAQIALGLTEGLARGSIDLHGPLLGSWMQGLVAAGCITADRMTVIMTP